MFRLFAWLALVLAAVPAAAQESWRRVTFADLGVSAEFRGAIEAGGYFDPSKEISTSIAEWNGADLDPPGAGMITAALIVGNQDQAALDAAFVEEASQGEAFDLRTREAVIGGARGRILEWTHPTEFNDVFITAARVQRDGVLYSFTYMRPVRDSAEAVHFQSSIRFDGNAIVPAIRSRALLLTAIGTYWMSNGDATTARLSPSLTAIAAPKRASESATVQGYGSIDAVGPARSANGWHTFRVEHEKAVVDWSIAHDGQWITGLTWKLVSRK